MKKATIFFVVFIFCRRDGISQVKEIYSDGLYFKLTHQLLKDSVNIKISITNTKPYSLYIPSCGSGLKPCIFLENIGRELIIGVGSNMKNGNYLSSFINVVEFKPNKEILFDTTFAKVKKMKTLFFADFISEIDLINLKKESGISGTTIQGTYYYKYARIFRTVFYNSKLRRDKSKSKMMKATG